MADQFVIEANQSHVNLMKGVNQYLRNLSPSGEVHILPGALDHTCADCTHPKRFKQDLINEGAILSGNPFEVVEADTMQNSVRCLLSGSISQLNSWTRLLF